MSGIDLRLKKLFNGKKNLVISALDHVMEYGDQPGIEDAAKAIANCHGTDALLMSRFMLKRHPDLMAAAGAPAPVVRINWSSSFYYPLDYRQGNTCIATTVEEAVEAGAEAVICSLFLEDGDERRETDNVRTFSEVVRQKERLGIPLIGECYVVEHKEIGPERMHAKVKRVTRVMAELGADLIKCFFTGERFHEVVANVPGAGVHHRRGEAGHRPGRSREGGGERAAGRPGHHLRPQHLHGREPAEDHPGAERRDELRRSA